MHSLCVNEWGGTMKITMGSMMRSSALSTNAHRHAPGGPRPLVADLASDTEPLIPDRELLRASAYSLWSFLHLVHLGRSLHASFYIPDYISAPCFLGPHYVPIVLILTLLTPRASRRPLFPLGAARGSRDSDTQKSSYSVDKGIDEQMQSETYVSCQCMACGMALRFQ